MTHVHTTGEARPGHPSVVFALPSYKLGWVSAVTLKTALESGLEVGAQA